MSLGLRYCPIVLLGRLEKTVKKFENEITGLWVKIKTDDPLNSKHSNCNPQITMLENCHN